MKRPTKVQSVILSVMRERRPSDPADFPGLPAVVDRGITHITSRAEGVVLMNSRTALAMLKHGWIEWHPHTPARRSGYYVTDAGREVLLTW